MASKTKHILSFFVFFIVMAVGFAALSGCATTSNWVRNMICRYYYRFDGDYSFLSELNGKSVEEMVAELDIYSAYYTAEEYAEQLQANSGHRRGIGISYTVSSDGSIAVVSVFGGSPALSAGLKAGDVIVSAAYGQNSAQGEELEDFINSSPEGAELQLTLSDGRTVSVTRCSYTASYASMYTSSGSYSFEYKNGERVLNEGDDGIAELPVHAAYMRLNQFYGAAAEEMAELAKIFGGLGCNTLVLDLRGNGGGYVDVMTKIGGLFTSAEHENALAMSAIYKDGSSENTYCAYYSEGGFPAGTKVYVMADEDTASASEALIGVLVSYNIADYPDIFLSDYGADPPKSYGKGIMQSMFTNAVTGAALKLTVAGIYWPNGKTIHGTGLTLEDGCTSAPASDDIVTVGYDDELEAVLKKMAEDSAA